MEIFLFFLVVPLMWLFSMLWYHIGKIVGKTPEINESIANEKTLK